MKKFVKLMALLMAAAMLLTGCAGNNQSGNNTATRDDLVIGIVNEPTALIPSTAAYDAQSNGRIVDNIYEGLMYVDANGEIQPNIAESWEISPDGMTYTFKLRNDVKFHNGDTLTAEDVKYSFDECAKAGYSVEITDAFVETIAQDDTTFVLKIATPNAPMLRNLAVARGLYIMNKKVAEELGDKFPVAPVGAGTGPYKFESWESGQNVVIVANEDYRNGAPAIKKVTWKFIKEASTGAISLETGDIDIYADISMVDVPNLQNNDKIQVSLIQGDYVYYLCMNQKKEIFQDVRVRQAFAYAMNLDELIMAVTNGIGGTKTGSLTTPACFGYKEYAPVEQDIEKAKQLLAEAGYPDGITVEVAVCAGTREKIGETLQGMLKKAGIEVVFKSMEMSALAEYATGDQHDFLPQVAKGYIPDADSELTDKVVSDSWGNFSRMNVERVDELMALARQESDSAKRIEMYHEVQDIVHDEAHIIPLYYVNSVSAANANLKGFVTRSDLSYHVWEMSW
ncbi:MAG: ABC transporter substrate-binding protein [Ruminococcaceae bacterium]|nr:ABC transporter substrate-binding protein [Oscillospiraceae bacterium]